MNNFNFALKYPQIYLKTHFKELQEQVNESANSKLSLSSSSSDDQQLLNKLINDKRNLMLNKIQTYENECLEQCDFTANKFALLLINNNNNQNSDLLFLDYKRELFLNKNLIFIKPIKILATKYNNNETAIGKLISVNKYRS
jgi:hypothetical protein